MSQSFIILSDVLTLFVRLLNRNMRFLADGFRNSLSNPKEELKESFKKSYDSTLKQHHGFLVKNLVGVGITFFQLSARLN